MQISERILEEVKKAVIGKDDVLKKIFMAMLAGGHVLMEDIPGVGKTTIAQAFADAMKLNCKRMQFTVDVLPSDVTGYCSLDMKSGETRFHKGAIFTNMFLADEINRTSSRTQAALLEVMEEGRVSVEGITMTLEEPFMVIATQNPYGSAGTQLLPESQLDRFMIRLAIGYPDEATEMEILKRRQVSTRYPVQPVASREEILLMRKDCQNVFVHDDLYAYCIQLLQATRKHPRIYRGASPRAGLSLIAMAKACAYLNDRDYVIPKDMQSVFIDTIAHRILMQPNQGLDAKDAKDVLLEVLEECDMPQRNRTPL